MSQIYSNTRITLEKRLAKTNPTRAHFGMDSTQVDAASLVDGQILVQTLYLSIDPYLYMPMGIEGVHGEKAPPSNFPYKLLQFKDAVNIIDLHDVFGGRGVAKVLASMHSNVPVGALIASDNRWQQYAIITVDEEVTFEVLESDIFSDPKISPSNALGILSVSGSHALNGFKALNLQKGQTIVVSAAAGNIGVIVTQLAKHAGLHVIAIVGGSDKSKRFKEEFGVDVVDYKQFGDSVADFVVALKSVASNGVDGYFDNVSGFVSNAVDQVLNEKATVYACGAIARYSSGGTVDIPEDRVAFYKAKNVNVITSLQLDYMAKVPQARRELYELIKKGDIKAVEWITNGIENCGIVFEEMYNGKNYGKSIIKVS